MDARRILKEKKKEKKKSRSEDAWKLPCNAVRIHKHSTSNRVGQSFHVFDLVMCEVNVWKGGNVELGVCTQGLAL